MGHKVVMTANGEECFDTFSKACGDYDAILMDLQVRCYSTPPHLTSGHSHDIDADNERQRIHQPHPLLRVRLKASHATATRHPRPHPNICCLGIAIRRALAGVQ